MDPVSTAAGVAGLITLTLELSQSFVSYSKAVKHEPDEIRSLVTELDSINSVLLQLESFLRRKQIAGVTFNQSSALIVALEKCDQTADKLMKRLGRLESDGLSRTIERLRWPFSEKEVQKALESLRRCSSAFHFSLTVEGCKLLSQASATAEISLEIQRANSEKILELSQTITSMKGISAEASQASAQLQAILELIRGFTVNSSEIQQLTNSVNKLSSRIEEQAEQEIFDWLSTTHYSQKHHEIRKKRLMNTGEWLLECDTFKDWKQQRYVTLCCTGDPGVGKSVLTSLVIDNLQDSCASDVEMLAYFYFDYQTSQTQTAGAFICGILRQSLGSMSFFPESLLSFYAEHKNEQAPDFQDELRNILFEVFNEFESHIVIIDAFDECQNPSDRKAILNVLTQLESRGAKLFITSRPHCLDIFQAFESKVVLPVKAHEHDIRAYCRSLIDTNNTMAELVDNSLRDQILNSIATHAQGITDLLAYRTYFQARFLLAVLHIQGVTEALTKADIRKHLNSLTADLGQAFKGSLHRINKQSVRRKQVALRALTWVSTTYRSILAEELCHALATEIGDRALDEDAILTPKLIVDSCLGLIYIEESTSQVYLVHLALKEHLQAEKLISEDTMDAQTYVTNTLLTYLCLNEEDKDRYDESLPQLRRELCLSFYTYATCNWGFHARLASPNLIRKHALRYLQKEHAYARGLTSLFEHISTKSERVPIYTLTDLAQVPHQLTGLHVAAAFGLSTLVQDLLDLGIEVDALDEQRNTALHVASANGQTEAAIVLLQSNAKVNISNIFAHTPLYDAVIMSQEALVSELLNRGAAAEVKCAWEWSPLQKAADKGDLTIAKLLIKHGASIMSRSARGLIPLHRAAGQGHLEMIKELLKAGSPVDSQTVDGWSPLHGACSAGQTKAVNLLITNHANVNLQSFNGCTALHRACRRNHYQIVQALVEHGANLLCQNSEGDIPLHQAAKGNSLVICKFLIRHANSSAPLQLRSVNNFHRTPREEASYHGYRHVADELQQHELENGIIQGTEMSDLEMAVKDHNLPCLKMLLAGNSDADFGKLENLTLLHLALLLDDEDISRYLMGLPTVNIASVTVDGWQPLHCAANVGNSTLVELCLDHGAPVSAKTSDGQTPLHKACQTGDLDCVELLLDAGADVNADDVCGLTPLHTASSAGFQSIVELLISHGAKINVRDKSLRTPQICAAEAGNHAICQFWRQRHNPEWNFRRAAASQEL